MHTLKLPILSILLCLTLNLSAQEIVILTSDDQHPEPGIEGDKSLLEKKVSPASTFKMVLTWIALNKKGVSPDQTFTCTDAHVPGSPRKLSLPEAMFYSSNDYFVQLTRGWDATFLHQEVQASGFFGDTLPKDWWDQDPKSIPHAGQALTTASFEHTWIRKVMMGELFEDSKIQEKFLECLAWPSSDKKVKLYGKTGSWYGVFWYNGFGVTSKGKKAVTILCTGKKGSRELAVKTFYQAFDQSPPSLK